MYQVGIVMGSDSDWPILKQAAEICEQFNVRCKAQVLSAHRTPFDMLDYAKTAHLHYQVLIAGAGGAAHLPGMLASVTILPVIGVPIANTALNGLDALLSIVQMPAGVPVATVGVGNAKNAGVLAMSILGVSNQAIQDQLHVYKDIMARQSREKNKTLHSD